MKTQKNPLCIDCNKKEPYLQSILRHDADDLWFNFAEIFLRVTRYVVDCSKQIIFLCQKRTTTLSNSKLEESSEFQNVYFIIVLSTHS